jgi:hypothetical protein
LTVADQHIADAALSLQVAWDGWVDEQIVALHEQYREAASSFLKVVDRGLAMAIALGHRNTHQTLHRLAIPKEVSSRNSLITRIGHDSWRRDAEAVALYESLLAIRHGVKGGAVDGGSAVAKASDTMIDPVEPFSLPELEASISADVPVSESD